ncbi:MAG: hypothetical protein WC506_06115 [Candidatus Micrarchaeia archaeon]
MRLITHTDLDGVACAVLLTTVEQIDQVKFIDPGTIQSGKIEITGNDILADLPFDKRAGMWFDHHESSKPKDGQEFEGMFRIAPSAARVVYEYYDNPYLAKYERLVEGTDRIDSGQVSKEEATSPTGLFLLSNTLETAAPKAEDDDYRRHVIRLLRHHSIEETLENPRVKDRCANVKNELEAFRRLLEENTVMIGKVAFSDLREKPELPRGNNYVVYSLFPQAVTSVRLMPLDEGKDDAKISVGHNIYGKKSEFNVGEAMRRIGGGGHRPVGGATVKKEAAYEIAMRIAKEINDFEEKQGKG